MRVRFRKGQQRKFLDRVLKNIGCVSMRNLIQRGFEIPYSTLKNYYSEQRLLPKGLFDNLCYVAKIDSKKLKFEIVEDNWGKVLGGMKSKKKIIS